MNGISQKRWKLMNSIFSNDDESAVRVETVVSYAKNDLL